jgi:antitoxin PrlF
MGKEGGAMATLTSKGQVTLPAEVRAALGLKPGSRTAFVQTLPGVFELVPETGSVRDLKRTVPAPVRPVSVEDMDQSIGDATASGLTK